jgi:hypothetical protein
VPSGLYALDAADTSAGDGDGIGQGAQIVLNQSGNTITGSVGLTDYFTITVNPATGEVTFTQLANVWHSNTGNDDDTSTLNLSSADLLKLVQTVTDADGDHDAASINLGSGVFQIEDDGPNASVGTSGPLTLVLDETRPVGTETDGDSDPAGLDTVKANFSSSFLAPDYGSDGPGSVSYSLSLTGLNVPSGLYALDATDKSAGDGDGIGQGAQIVLNQVGNVITGSAGGTDYFTISINTTTGEVTFTQLANIWHSNTGNDDDTATLTLSSADLLKVVQTVTDADGDHDAASINLGSGVFQIEDDGPDAALADKAVSALVLDETRPVGTETDGDSDPAGLDTVTVNFSGNFKAPDYGSDGPGSVAYALSLTGSNVASGLYALDAADKSAGDGDGIGQGAQIVLNQSGNTITGSVGLADYFTITVNPATGEVTFTQLANIWHSNTGNDDDTATLTLSSADLLKLVQTVTDADGDHDAASINLGSGVFQIEDDGPDAVVSNAVAAAIVLDETRPVGTETDGDSDPAGLATKTVNYAGNFAAVTDFGSDGPGSVTYSLSLTGSNVPSGLYALDASDTSAGDGDGIGQGTQIVLNLSGNTITGSVGATDYFTITVNPANGDVTFTQINNIWHANTGNDDDTATLNLSSADLLKLVQTVTDADGDHDAASINLGQGVFQIEDDGPDATTSGTGSITLVLDETRPVGTETDGDSAPAGLATVQGNFSIAFNAPDYGSDGAGSVSYSLNLTGTNVLSGLFALDLSDKSASDGDGIGKGAQIVLNQSGNTITGSVGLTNYFTITIDPLTGVVTFTQLANIWHANTGSDDDTSTLSLLAANLLQVVQTVTDADGDKDTAGVDIGQGVFQIEDDGPKYISPDTLHLENKGVIGTSDQVIANLNFVAGTDGVNNVVFNVAGVPVGVTSGATVIATDGDGHQLKVNGELLYLYYGGAGGDDTTILVAKTLTGTVGFTIDIDPVSGTYTFNPEAAISNGTEVSATDLTGVGGGNVPFKLLIDIGGTTQDVAMTTKSGASVNTDHDDIGISQGQTFESGESIRFDLVNGLKLDGGTPEGYSYDGTHNATTRWKETVLLTGNSSQNADFVVSAIVADSDNTFFGDAAGESLINLATSNIHIYDKLGSLIDPLNYGGLGISVIDIGNSIEIDGIKDGMSYEIVTDNAHQFNAVQVDALPTTDTFSLSFFAYGENSAGTSADLSYNVVGTDGDGDPANGTIDVSLYPDATSSSGTSFAGTASNDTFLGTQGVDSISGLGGDDRLAGNAGIDTINGGAGNDTIIGGSGNDNLTGGTNSDTFVYETLVDGKDSISDFDITAPGSGGDKIDVSQVLDHAGNTWTDNNTVADAVAGGYLTFTNSGGFVQVNVDIDGSAGNSFAPTAVAVLANVAFVSAAQAATDLNDNIVVG